MKRTGSISEETASCENIMKAVCEAEKRCNRRRSYMLQIEKFDSDLTMNVERIQRIIQSGEWPYHAYRTFTRREHGKVRKIDWNPDFTDAVIQHALYQTAGKVLEKCCIIDTYSGFRGRGMVFGARRLKSFLSEYAEDEPLYVLKADISKYYQNIDTALLYGMIEGKIKDATILRLFKTMLDSHPDGLPIGNFLSQLLANFYLNRFDHWMKESMKARHYCRYCDDIVVLSADKGRLKKLLEEMERKLAALGLALKPNVQVFPIERYGIDFMGFVFRRKDVRLRKRIERGLKRAAHLFGKHPCRRRYNSLASYYGWTRELTRGDALWNAVTGGRTMKMLFKEAKGLK